MTASIDHPIPTEYKPPLAPCLSLAPTFHEIATHDHFADILGAGGPCYWRLGGFIRLRV